MDLSFRMQVDIEGGQKITNIDMQWDKSKQIR